ncbi:hypothetical protein ACLB9X_02630 [Streptomyces sp. 5K101]|uniref:hypothetical protein n=1 Tax=Streptomyces sp. 5K101 TaxID=3390037 RepID=UPI003976843E
MGGAAGLGGGSGGSGGTGRTGRPDRRGHACRGANRNLCIEEWIPTKLTLKLEKKKGKGKDALEALGGKRGLTLKAKLTAEGQPLEGRPIEFTTDAISLCTETTDSKGKATCKVPRGHENETCYTATFDGDDTYEPDTTTVCTFNDNDNGKPDSASELLDRSTIGDLVNTGMTPAGLQG